MSQLPKGWVHTTLGDICSKPQYGYTTKADPVLGGVKFLRTTDITKGRLNWDTVPYCMEPPSESSKYQLVEGDIVIARSGSVGVSYLIDKAYEPAVFASYLIRFKPITPVLSQYVKAFLDSHLFWEQVEVNKAGNALQNINAQKLSAMSFPLPPLAEQTRIVEKLDEVLAQVDTIKARLDGIPAILKRFRQSVLAAAVSGKLTGIDSFSSSKFSDLILEMKNGLSPKPNENALGSPILRISSVRPKEIDFNDHRYLECDDKTIKTYKLKDRDLLFTRYNGSLEFVGVCGLVSGILDSTYLYPDKLIRVRTNHDVLLPEYAELFFCSSGVRKTITDFVKSTSGQKGISGKDLKSVVVYYPDLTEQKEIVRLVDQYFAFADTIEAQVKKAQARVDKLTQSILAKAFRGELVPQDPNDEPADKLLERIALARKEAEVLAKAAKKTAKK
ncbi:restriction endonuclease subunit S [Vibrio cholerae]|nr:restriction endonuclease subunit S [Vibrio cholerae]EJL6741133.1 restriction endonuclease subunit S [Vibrio cholerae]